jgi:hypothetical protein
MSECLMIDCMNRGRDCKCFWALEEYKLIVGKEVG